MIPRGPVHYRRPRSWGIGSLVVLALAGVGAATIGKQLVARWRSDAAAPVASAANEGRKWTLESARGDGVLFTFKLSPRDARVFLDRELVQSNPVRVTKSERAHEIVVSRAGYRDHVVELVADRDRTIDVTLAR